MKKYIVSVASCLFALCMQSCFQDMDHPAFDYPKSCLLYTSPSPRD